MTDFQLKCKHTSHNNQEIIAVCTNSRCKQPRLSCFDCLMKDKIHNQHSDDIIQLMNFNQWKQNGVQTIQLIKKMINDTDNLSQLFKQILLENQKAIQINLGFATSSEIEEHINYIYKIRILGSVIQGEVDQVSFSIQKILIKFKQLQGYQINFQQSQFQQIAEVQQNMLTSAIQKIKIRFSQQEKGQKIEVSDESLIAKCVGWGSGFCPCQPVLRNVETTFAIKYISGIVAIGVCIRDYARKTYQNPNFSNIGHGSYLIRNNGYTNSHHQIEMNWKQLSFKFFSNTVIIVKVDLGQQKITWMNQQTRQLFVKFQSMQLNQKESKYFPCVNLFAGSVQIIEKF